MVMSAGQSIAACAAMAVLLSVATRGCLVGVVDNPEPNRGDQTRRHEGTSSCAPATYILLLSCLVLEWMTHCQTSSRLGSDWTSDSIPKTCVYTGLHPSSPHHTSASSKKAALSLSAMVMEPQEML